MKNIAYIIIAIMGLGVLNAQVAIERTTGDVRGSAIMDFEEPAKKGVLLPLVSGTVPAPADGGALIFNTTTQTVEVYNNGTTSWEPITQPGEASIQGTEHAGTSGRYAEKNPINGTIIEDGTGGTPPEGVLVLESSKRALLLPRVPDATALPGPKAGLICYDVSRDAMAVFNGTVWTFLE